MKSYIINLSRIESSRTTAERVKTDLEKFGLEPELFEGSYGNEMVDLFQTQQRQPHPFTFKGPSRLLSEKSRGKITLPGVMGCFYSHYRLWQRCYDLGEPILVFEDDVIFSRGWYPVEWQDVLITCLGNIIKSAKYRHYLDNPEGKPRAEPYHQASMPGTVGYAIKPHAAEKLLRAYEHTFLPSDNAMMKHYVQIEVHSHIMGRAMTADDGKKSLVRGKGDFWEKFKE